MDSKEDNAIKKSWFFSAKNIIVPLPPSGARI